MYADISDRAMDNYCLGRYRESYGRDYFDYCDPIYTDLEEPTYDDLDVIYEDDEIPEDDEIRLEVCDG